MYYLNPRRLVLKSTRKRHQPPEMLIWKIKVCSETYCNRVGQQGMIMKADDMDGYGQLT